MVFIMKRLPRKPSSESCETCRWFVVRGHLNKQGFDFGECRRRSPVRPEVKYACAYPSTNGHEWCGEHQEQIEEA